MEANNQIENIDRFKIIFEKLEEGKKEQEVNFMLDLETVMETNNTILLFKEYTDSITESCSQIFTRS